MYILLGYREKTKKKIISFFFEYRAYKNEMKSI